MKWKFGFGFSFLFVFFVLFFAMNFNVSHALELDEPFDLTKGNITITKGTTYGVDVNYGSGSRTDVDGEIVITSNGTETENIIQISDNVGTATEPVKIVFDGLKISNNESSAVSVGKCSFVNIETKGLVHIKKDSNDPLDSATFSAGEESSLVFTGRKYRNNFFLIDSGSNGAFSAEGNVKINGAKIIATSKNDGYAFLVAENLEVINHGNITATSEDGNAITVKGNARFSDDVWVEAISENPGTMFPSAAVMICGKLTLDDDVTLKATINNGNAISVGYEEQTELKVLDDALIMATVKNEGEAILVKNGDLFVDDGDIRATVNGTGSALWVNGDLNLKDGDIILNIDENNEVLHVSGKKNIWDDGKIVLNGKVI